jgi:hypothetical protein
MTSTVIADAGFSRGFKIIEESPWSYSFSGAFTEYAAIQDSMEVAFPSNLSNLPVGSVVDFGFGYHPGFEVGFVLNTPYDNWSLNAGYLWYRGSSHVSKQSDGSIFYSSPLFGTEFYNHRMSSFDADWHLGLDLIDLYLTRPYYSGNKLTVTPMVGLRGDLIREHFQLDGNVFGGAATSQTAKTKSRLWGVGPRLGVEGDFIYFRSWSFFGKLATSLLYTNYTKIRLDYNNSLNQKANAKNDGVSLFHPNIDAGLGLNFGEFWWKKVLYCNLRAAYNFSIFFSQNMERALVSSANESVARPENLYLQGVSIGLDFIF